MGIPTGPTTVQSPFRCGGLSDSETFLPHSASVRSLEPSHSPVLPLPELTCGHVQTVKRQEEWEAVTETMLGGGKRAKQITKEGRNRRPGGSQVLPTPKCLLRVSQRPAAKIRYRGHHLWGLPLCSSQNLVAGIALPPPNPFSGHRSYHGDVSQSHGGCGPGTAHCFLSMAHRHSCSQAGWP